MLRRLAAAVLILAAAVSAGIAQRVLDSMQPAEGAGRHLLYLPSGKYLRALAPGYREVLADLIYLWSIQYYSDYAPADRYVYLEHIYAGVITELDPHYEDPYLVGAMIMALEAKDVEMALRLLDKGIAANPDNWLMPFEAGFYCYDTLHDYRRAAAYFDKALKVPGVHPVVRRLRAEMFNKLGDKRTSLRLWLQIYETAHDEYVRSVSFHHVHDLKLQVDVDTLRTALEVYRGERGSWPATLGDLVKAGIIDRVPVQPNGDPYLYNRRTGQVRATERFLLLRSGS